MTNKDLHLAKEWAKGDFDQAYIHAGPRAAARVIQSLPDTIVDGDELRKVINKILTKAVHGTVGHQVANDYAALIGALIPDPSLPTLADMTPEERAECLWMQVDLPRHLPGAVLADPGGPGSDPRVMYQDGATFTVKHEDVTPLQGEPKLGWPGDGVVDAEIVEDDEPVMMPRPEDVHAGEAWLIRYEGKKYESFKAGGGNDPQPWIIRREDEDDYWWVYNYEVTLISRLVPEVTP